MPRQTTNIEFLNMNSQRSYPLAEHATKLDMTGSFELPDDFLVEVYFPVHAGLDVETDRFYLHSVSVFSSGYNLTFAYDNGTTVPDLVASVNVARSAHVENDVYALPGIGDWADSLGKLVIGRTETISSLGAGRYLFDRTGGQLDPDAIRPMIRGIRSVILVNNGDRSDPIYGDIELIAGANIRLTPSVSAVPDPETGVTSTVRIDAIAGEGLTEACDCEGDEEAPAIRTINGIPPTAGGNFTLLGNDCMAISPITNGLKLEDVCSDPCCGCEELEAITRDLDRFGSSARTLENIVNRLEAEVSQMNSVVLGSRLGTNTCLEC